jgi:hypothetical protein
MQFRGFEIIGIELAQVYYQNIASVLSLFNMHLFDRRHYRVIIPIILSNTLSMFLLITPTFTQSATTM